MVIWVDATDAALLVLAAEALIDRLDSRDELPDPRLLSAMHKVETRLAETTRLLETGQIGERDE